MVEYARFGPPVASFVPGGAHVSVHIVPVFNGAIVAFDVAARAAQGRWLPWDLLPYGGNPYETAAELGDTWCDGAVTDLVLADTLSFVTPGESWELSLIFRAELSTAPTGDVDRHPILLAPGDLDSVARFEAVDLERWLGPGEPSAPTRKDDGLLF